MTRRRSATPAPPSGGSAGDTDTSQDGPPDITRPQREPRGSRQFGSRRELKTGATRTGGLVVGVGVSSRAQPRVAVEALSQLLAELRKAGRGGSDAPVIGVTTWADKADHPVVRAIAKDLDVPIWPHDAEVLRAHDPGSARVVSLTARDDAPGIGSVARAAVLSSAAEPLHEKRIAAGCTYVVGWREGPVQEGVRQAARPPVDPLRHHGDAEARDCRIDFAVNVAVTQPPDWLRSAMNAAMDTVAAYPDERGVRLRLAEELGLDPERLLLVNGAAEAFMLIAHARPWRAPLVVHPQFTEPDAALRAAGRPAAHHILDVDDDFTLRPDAVPTDADLVVIGNPTNPTSRLHTKAAIRVIRDSGPRDRVVLVDEAFMDLVFAYDESLLADAGGGGEPGVGSVVVVRSLTKSFGLAGIRAGYVVGEPEFIARLRELQPPWSVNSLALAAIDAVAGSRGRAHLDGYAMIVGAARQVLVKDLTRCGLTVVADPQAAFVLARHPDAAAVRERLRQKGIAVRRGDTFPGLGPEWLRFAARSGAAEQLAYQLKPIIRDLDRAAGRRRRTRRAAPDQAAETGPPARRSASGEPADPSPSGKPADLSPSGDTPSVDTASVPAQEPR